MNKIEVVLEDFASFKGGWGLAPYPTYFALKYVTYLEELSVLEFGSGEGTTILTNLLQKKQVPYRYRSIEHDAAYAKTPGVQYQLYSISHQYTPSEIDEVELQLEGVYDLVIVDGPHGVGRARWYSKFKDYVREGTIVLIDDYHHYKEFGDEFCKHFEYEVVNLFNENPRFTPYTINEGMERVDLSSSYIMDKTYKVVRIKRVKK